jgi:mannan endo-1,4-beta-mannosidase
VTEDGQPWHPIGHNDALAWVTLKGLYGRRDMAGIEAYLAMLARHGVTVLRVMMEYAQSRHRYFEKPCGTWNPAMVRLWDDMFEACGRHGLRLLLTPFDTYWTWKHWHRHPYNRDHGGPLDHPSRILLCPQTRQAIKDRLEFAARRWGGSGTLFAWDLWNEIHPAQAQDSADCFPELIADLSCHVRRVEERLYGRSHPQTVSLFGPEIDWRPTMPLKEPIFRHADLDFATIHIYRHGTIDDPRDTVAPAIDMGRIVRASLAEIADGRPFLDTEHGPIHRYKDKRRSLPAEFDDEYFRHLQWAHLASGGAGGGMRWPNRTPHCLSPGMHQAQEAMTRFLPLIDWGRFRRVNLNEEVGLSSAGFTVFACGDVDQAVVYLLRTDALDRSGRIDRNAAPASCRVTIPELLAPDLEATFFDTREGRIIGRARTREARGRRGVELDVPAFTGDLAIAFGRGRP